MKSIKFKLLTILLGILHLSGCGSIAFKAGFALGFIVPAAPMVMLWAISESTNDRSYYIETNWYAGSGSSITEVRKMFLECGSPRIDYLTLERVSKTEMAAIDLCMRKQGFTLKRSRRINWCKDKDYEIKKMCKKSYQPRQPSVEVRLSSTYCKSYTDQDFYQQNLQFIEDQKFDMF